MNDTAKKFADTGKALGGEFKSFISKGNIVDLAVAVIIGGAFGKIVSSLVADVIMPPLGLLLAKVDFKQLKWVIQPGGVADGKEVKEVAIGYGLFIQNTVDFLIIAFVIFLVVKILTSMTKKPEPHAAPPTTKDCPKCLMSIPIKAVKCGHCTSEIPA